METKERLKWFYMLREDSGRSRQTSTLADDAKEVRNKTIARAAAAGLSQREIAQATGLTQQQISNIVKERENASAS